MGDTGDISGQVNYDIVDYRWWGAKDDGKTITVDGDLPDKVVETICIHTMLGLASVIFSPPST
jgi:hypothetical protein